MQAFVLQGLSMGNHDEEKAKRRDEMAVRDTLALLIKENGTNMKRLSLDLGMNETYVQQFLTKHQPRVLPEDIRIALSHRFKRPEYEFLPAYLRTKKVNGLIRNSVENFPAGVTIIEEVEISRGVGAGDITLEVRALWQVSPGWVTQFETTPDDLKILTIRGNSMVSDPPSRWDLWPNDKVVVDVGQYAQQSSGVFILLTPTGYEARNVQFLFERNKAILRIWPNNPAFETVRRLREEVEILGRIVGRWQRF